MGKFCTKCGRPLADGEVCNCQGTAGSQVQLVMQEQPQYQQAIPQEQP